MSRIGRLLAVAVLAAVGIAAVAQSPWNGDPSVNGQITDPTRLGSAGFTLSRSLYGSGIPTKPCNTIYNDGAFYTDVSSLKLYQCSNTGGIYAWSVVGGSSGVSSINSSTGAFTFTGAGVSCSGTTCTFSGGGGGSGVDVLSNQRATGTQFHQEEEYAAPSSGSPITLLSQTGAGVVSSIHIVLNGTNAYQAIGKSTISITVNGGASPTISMPLSAFFGAGYLGANGSTLDQYSSIFVRAASNATNAYDVDISTRLPIPFANAITITLTVNVSNLTLWSEVQGNSAPDTWPYTEKLWAQYICPTTATSTTLCAATGASTPSYGQEQIANYVGSNPGRLAGIYFLTDNTPGNMLPRFADLEGNYRIFTDKATYVWSADHTLSGSVTLMDPNGNQQTASSGTTGGTIPTTWGCYTGATTSDNTATWIATVGTPANVWRASKAYSLACMSVLDTNGNIETVTITGTTGSSAPAWPSTASCPGTSTTDGGVTWKCSLGSSSVKADLVSTGTEDFFFSLDYWINQVPEHYGASEIGMGFPVSTSSGTVSAWRYFVSEPIRFNTSLTVYHENGDSSDVPITSGTGTSLQTVWFYTQDTN
jgi:hypothetical protein